MEDDSTLTPGALFGREAECGTLDRILDRLPDAGSALLIEGDPGIGKTSLIAEIKARAVHRGYIALAANSRKLRAGSRRFPWDIVAGFSLQRWAGDRLRPAAQR